MKKDSINLIFKIIEDNITKSEKLAISSLALIFNLAKQGGKALYSTYTMRQCGYSSEERSFKNYVHWCFSFPKKCGRNCTNFPQLCSAYERAWYVNNHRWKTHRFNRSSINSCNICGLWLCGGIIGANNERTFSTIQSF